MNRTTSPRRPYHPTCICATALLLAAAGIASCTLDETGTQPPNTASTGNSTTTTTSSSSSSSGEIGGMGGAGGIGGIGGIGGMGGAGGVGGTTCQMGLVDCNGICVDTNNDPMHCGMCDKACLTGATCDTGVCTSPPPFCMPDTMISCYNGPMGTADIGTCVSGTQTCLPDGTAFSPCMGEIGPAEEICGNKLDEDCDGVAPKGAACLPTNGLVVRYFLDEAANGTGPNAALDSAPTPLDLPLKYAVNVSYTNASTGRGLRWALSGLGGTAAAAIDGTKVFTALEGKTQATIEMVADIEGVTGSLSRFVNISSGTESGRFTFSSNSMNRIQFRWRGNVIAGDWPIDLAATDRAVMHVVLDTTDATDTNRVRFYVNGALIAGNTGTLPTLNQTIAIGTGKSLYIGNREGGIRSPQGAIYYAAIYDRPLADGEIAKNAEVLQTTDDP